MRQRRERTLREERDRLKAEDEQLRAALVKAADDLALLWQIFS
jgi:hypothetical protein